MVLKALVRRAVVRYVLVWALFFVTNTPFLFSFSLLRRFSRFACSLGLHLLRLFGTPQRYNDLADFSVQFFPYSFSYKKHVYLNLLLKYMDCHLRCECEYGSVQEPTIASDISYSSL